MYLTLTTHPPSPSCCNSQENKRKSKALKRMKVDFDISAPVPFHTDVLVASWNSSVVIERLSELVLLPFPAFTFL